MYRKIMTLVASGLLVAASATGAMAHHEDDHTANQHGLCTAEANGGNPGGNGNGNATPPDCEEEEEPDTEAPTFTEATFEDDVVTVTYSEPIECADVDTSDYEGTLVRDGQELGTEGPETATCEGETNTTVQLTADEGTTNALEPGDELVITATADNDVSDPAGNEQPEGDEVTATVPEE